MNLLLQNGMVYINGVFKKADVLIQDGVIVDIQRNISLDNTPVIDLNNLFIYFAGFCGCTCTFT